MASSLIKSPNRVPSLPSSVNVVSNNAWKSFPGIITNGGKDIYITVDIPWDLSNWGSTPTINVLTGSLRSVNGYLRSDFTNADLLSIDDLTWTASIASYAVILKGSVSTAISGAVNNSPVIYTGSLSIQSN